MTTLKKFPLIDADRNLCLDAVEIAASRGLCLAGSDKWSIRCQKLSAGPTAGLHDIVLDSGAMAISLLPERGMGLWKGVCGHLPLGWDSPVSLPRHPAFVDQGDRGNLGWLHGFNELLCRCGLSSNGPPGSDQGDQLTLHGRVANLPAHHVEVQIDPAGPGRLAIVGQIEEASMFGSHWLLKSTLATTAGSKTFDVIDEVTNLADTPQHLSLLYHINIGRPFLEAGATFAMPHQEVAPRDSRAAEGIDEWQTYLGPRASYAEQAYFISPLANSNGEALAGLINSNRSAALVVRFPVKQLPCFTLWKNTQADGNGYVTGLEPGLNYPNFRAFEREQGRLPLVQPGETRRLKVSLEVLDDAAQVAAFTTEVTASQKGKPLVFRQPAGGYSPV